MNLENKTVLITGGTGSLGNALVKRILTLEMGTPKKIIIFSRDEAKQHQMRLNYLNSQSATEEILYNNFTKYITFRIGDIRNFNSVANVLRESDVVIHTAAMKQVPTCEYFPYECVQTNIIGTQNIVQAINMFNLPVETVIGISSDKACKPINVYGMAKAIQERILINANITSPQTRFICVRYGNVLASRGSVIPLFQEQISKGNPLTITSPKMTRFFLTLNQGVNTIFRAYKEATVGEIYIPNIKSARIIDIAEILINNSSTKILYTSIRPGEKLHEILISEEEIPRTTTHRGYFIIKPHLPELYPLTSTPSLTEEYSSANCVMPKSEVKTLLKNYVQKE